MRVVGIVRRPLDLGVRAASGGIVMLTPAFSAKYEGRIGLYTDTVRVKTRAGVADVPRVVTAARKLWGDAPTFQVQPLGIETEGAHSAIDVLTLALWIFAGVTALAGIVAIGIVLTRDIAQRSSRSIDAPCPRRHSKPTRRSGRIASDAHRDRGRGAGRTGRDPRFAVAPGRSRAQS